VRVYIYIYVYGVCTFGIYIYIIYLMIIVACVRVARLCMPDSSPRLEQHINARIHGTRRLSARRLSAYDQIRPYSLFENTFPLFVNLDPP
jgi:hypothetical protein